MAKIVLKDPSSPSIKKTTKPPSTKYKAYFYRMVACNVVLLSLITYLVNKQKFDQVLTPVFNKIIKK
jgi:hypothetical protein